MAAKLLLVQDVEALGRSGDIVNVRPGFARNFLLPQGFAVIADANTIRMQAKLQEERLKKAAVDRKESEALAAKLEDQTVTTVVKVDHEGHMYGSVTAIDVAHLIHSQLGFEIEKRDIVLKHAIKRTGSQKVTIKLKEGVTCTIIVKVVSEQELNNEKAAAAKKATEE